MTRARRSRLVRCSSSPRRRARRRSRFADRAILWRDPDDAPVPMPPRAPAAGQRPLLARRRQRHLPPADACSSRRLRPRGGQRQRARRGARLDVVRGSAARPGHPSRAPRALPADVLARGAGADEPPQPPFRITARALAGGSAAGFVVDDALGRRYALKLDPEGHPGLVTGADAVATRLAWASGWRVPRRRDHRGRAQRAARRARRDDAERSGASRSRSTTATSTRSCGTARATPTAATASSPAAGSPGTALGPFAWLGRDAHDANDRYAHENRRDLRGFGVWAAWVDDIDVIENNTLDSLRRRAGPRPRRPLPARRRRLVRRLLRRRRRTTGWATRATSRPSASSARS